MTERAPATALQAAPTNPPSSRLPAAAQPGALPPASIRRRLAALVYESVLLFGVIFVAALAFSLVMQARNGLTYRHLMSVWIAIVAGVYFVGFWHRGGQTLPMKTWRLRVVAANGAPLSAGRAIARYVLAWLWFLPPLALHPLLGLTLPQTLLIAGIWFVQWAATGRFDPLRQFLHDRLAGTRVVSVSR